MKSVLLLFLILTTVLPSQDPAASSNESSVVVVSRKWAKSRLTTEQAQATNVYVAPAAAVTQAEINYQKRKINSAAGERPPATLDERRAELDRIVQESRKPNAKAVDGYAYRVKLKNAGAKVIEILFWEYQFSEISNPSTIVRRQFLCGVNIRPGKEKEVLSFSLSGPSDVIAVGTLSDKSGNPFHENVVINRVEYADGSIWQRHSWSFAEIKASYTRAISTPWGAEMCRTL